MCEITTGAVREGAAAALAPVVFLSVRRDFHLIEGRSKTVASNGSENVSEFSEPATEPTPFQEKVIVLKIFAVCGQAGSVCGEGCTTILEEA